MMDQTTEALSPRDRILEEAERLFSLYGFDGVTVRQITAAADANLAAVNYHFGGKENLYIEVFHSRWVPRARRVASQLESFAGEAGPDPETLVRTIAKAFFLGFSSDEERLRHHRLIAQEISRPTAALELILEEAIRPTMDRIAGLLAEALNCASDHKGLRLCVFSIFSQILYFNFARNAVTRLTGEAYTPEFVERVVDHITRFCLYGLMGPGGEDAS